MSLTMSLPLAASSPIAHVTDKSLFHLLGIDVWYLSNVTIMLAISAVLTGLILIPAAKRIAAGIETGESPRSRGVLANLVEAICMGLRDEIFKPILKEQTDKYMPILWTFFWFILICNLVGLVPILDLTYIVGKLTIFGSNDAWHGIGGTATQSIWVTGALAFVAFCFYNWQGLRDDPVAYFQHLTGGSPWYVWPFIVPVELMGIFIKPFALALRLFANMSGGHVLLAALFGFVPALGGAFGFFGVFGAGVVPVLGAVAIYVLEILVAFLQAFIFAFLVGLFLGQLVVHADHEDHHGKPGHEDDLPGTLDNRDYPLQGRVPGASI